MRLILVLWIVILSLFGCSNVVDYGKNLQKAPLCCNKLSEIQYKPLAHDKPLTTRIGEENSYARLFNNKKSFFSGFQLPKYEEPYEFQIQSNPIYQQLFLPNILILDGSYNVIKEIISSDFDVNNGIGTYKFFVNQDEGYSYLLFYTTNISKESEMRTAERNTTMISFPNSFYATYTSGIDAKSKVKTSEGGELTIRTIKYLPKSIEK